MIGNMSSVSLEQWIFLHFHFLTVYNNNSSAVLVTLPGTQLELEHICIVMKHSILQLFSLIRES